MSLDVDTTAVLRALGKHEERLIKELTHIQETIKLFGGTPREIVRDVLLEDRDPVPNRPTAPGPRVKRKYTRRKDVPNPKPKKSSKVELGQIRIEVLQRYERILKAMDANTGENKILSMYDLGTQLNIGAPGAKVTVAHLARHLAKHGLDLDEIFTRDITTNGIGWLPKEGIGYAIDLIQSQIKTFD